MIRLIVLALASLALVASTADAAVTFQHGTCDAGVGGAIVVGEVNDLFDTCARFDTTDPDGDLDSPGDWACEAKWKFRHVTGVGLPLGLEFLAAWPTECPTCDLAGLDEVFGAGSDAAVIATQTPPIQPTQQNVELRILDADTNSDPAPLRTTAWLANQAVAEWTIRWRILEPGIHSIDFTPNSQLRRVDNVGGLLVCNPGVSQPDGDDVIVFVPEPGVALALVPGAWLLLALRRRRDAS